MFDKLKEKLKNISEEGVSFTITHKMMEQLIEKYSPEKGIKVSTVNGQIILSGETVIEKMLIKKTIKYSLRIEPIQAEKRTIAFKLVEMKPIDLDFLNKKLFNRPPFLEYHQHIIKIDFNAMEKVQKIPLGKIKSFEVKEDGLRVRIGV